MSRTPRRLRRTRRPGWNACLAAVLRALDVPCPTCSGPIRETVGLVCQTCGTDYGAGDE